MQRAAAGALRALPSVERAAGACSTSGSSSAFAGALGDSLRAPGVFFQARGAKSRRMVEVILLEDVAGLGIAGHIVRVKPGRAHNYLIPTEAAKYNTYENRHRYKELIDAAGDVKLTATRDEADAEVDRIRLAVRLLRSAPVNLRAPPDTSSGVSNLRLYTRHHVTAEVLSHEVLRQLGVDLPPRAFDMKEPIRTFGEFKVPLRFTQLSEEGLAVRPSLLVNVRRVATKKLGQATATDAGAAPAADKS